jgi:hypothetical protein
MVGLYTGPNIKLVGNIDLSHDIEDLKIHEMKAYTF